MEQVLIITTLGTQSLKVLDQGRLDAHAQPSCSLHGVLLERSGPTSDQLKGLSLRCPAVYSNAVQFHKLEELQCRFAHFSTLIGQQALYSSLFVLPHPNPRRRELALGALTFLLGLGILDFETHQNLEASIHKTSRGLTATNPDPLTTFNPSCFALYLCCSQDPVLVAVVTLVFNRPHFSAAQFSTQRNEQFLTEKPTTVKSDLVAQSRSLSLKAKEYSGTKPHQNESSRKYKGVATGGSRGSIVRSRTSFNSQLPRANSLYFSKHEYRRRNGTNRQLLTIDHPTSILRLRHLRILLQRSERPLRRLRTCPRKEQEVAAQNLPQQQRVHQTRMFHSSNARCVL